MKYLGMGLIRLYQMTLSVILPPSCRFTPSCSHYGYEAIETYGLLKGGWMALKRIGRCHPFYHGNLYDPVPQASSAGERGTQRAVALDRERADLFENADDRN
ncbi:MAG: membrane protein insertion efficiency factor YidD [Ktedonobacterales bacterium]|nr:membrane protein insertion efficiency factor YidD [Ktedonobacterales bacterium]